ncbi:MAG: S8 family serine peptidase [Candidatus Eiseniibacteriota bacterium]
MPSKGVLAVGVILALSTSIASRSSASDPEYAPDEVLVKVASGTSSSQKQNIYAKITGTVLQSFARIGWEYVKLDSMSVEAALDTLENDPYVDDAQPNYYGGNPLLSQPNDPYFSSSYHLKNTGQSGGTAGADIDAVLGWDYVSGSPNVLIAVLDSGVDYEHEDLADNMWTNATEASGTTGVDDDGNGYVDDIHGYNFADGNGDPMDTRPHGTHVASVVAAKGNNSLGVTGVTWQAKMAAVKIVKDSGFQSTGRLSQAIAWTDTGDDGNSGKAQSYHFKYSTSPITNDAQFTAASYVPVDIGPIGANGAPHCIEIDDLAPCTTYYWALKLEDNAFNISTLGQGSTASASTTCSGPAYVLCEGGGWLQGGGGGGGGGGESANVLPAEVAASALGVQAQAQLDLQAGVSDEPRWVAENELRTESEEAGAADLVAIRHVRQNEAGEYVLRIMAARDALAVSSAELGVVDQVSGPFVLGTTEGIYSGRRAEIRRCVTESGVDRTRLYTSGEGGASSKVGEALVVTLPEEEGRILLGLEIASLAREIGTTGEGVSIQARVEGDWRTLEHVATRRQFEEIGVDVGSAREVRLVASRPVHIRSIFGIAEALRVEPDWMELSRAETLEGDQHATLTAGNEPVAVMPSDALVLAFRGNGQAGDGMERKLFFKSAMERVPGPAGMSRHGTVAPASSFVLGPASPNPTTGRVKFIYSLATETEAHMQIYNAAGRLIRNIVGGSQTAGPHEMTWDGRTNTGDKVSPGVYFYRLEAGGWHSERKLIVITR